MLFRDAIACSVRRFCFPLDERGSEIAMYYVGYLSSQAVVVLVHASLDKIQAKRDPDHFWRKLEGS